MEPRRMVLESRETDERPRARVHERRINLAVSPFYPSFRTKCVPRAE